MFNSIFGFIVICTLKVILTKDNLIKDNGPKMKHVVFAITRNPYNIYSLNALWLKLSGA
jgi:hypothetical protein